MGDAAETVKAAGHDLPGLPGVRGMKQRKGTLPRASSPAGVKARQERRLKGWVEEVPKGGSGTQRHCKPGSRNPKKVGR